MPHFQRETLGINEALWPQGGGLTNYGGPRAHANGVVLSRSRTSAFEVPSRKPLLRTPSKNPSQNPSSH